MTMQFSFLMQKLIHSYLSEKKRERVRGEMLSCLVVINVNGLYILTSAFVILPIEIHEYYCFIFKFCLYFFLINYNILLL